MSGRKHDLLPALLKALWEEGFFSRPQAISTVEKRLAADGHHPAASSVRRALQRSVGAGGFLTSIKVSGKPTYIQKRPIISAATRRIDLFKRYDLHASIKRVAYKQFQDGYFKEAIQNALVEVIDQVKIAAGNPKNSQGRELDGDDLMNQVFGCDTKTPMIAFNDLHTTLDKAEQRGLMYLFKGVVGIRDRKAHLNFVQNDPLKTIEYLSLASLLVRLLDEKIPKNNP